MRLLLSAGRGLFGCRAESFIKAHALLPLGGKLALKLVGFLDDLGDGSGSGS